MPLSIPEIGSINDAFTRQILTKIVQEVNLIGTQAGVSGSALGAPPNIAAVSVSGGNGDLSIQISDPLGQAQPNLGLHYFVEWDTNPAFANPTQEDLGAARGDILRVGVQAAPVYVRVYSQFRSGPISKKVVFGTRGANGVVTPIPVSVSGASSPAPPGGGGGSGGGGGGFGGGGFGCPLSGAPVRLYGDPAWWSKMVVPCEEFIVVSTETGRTGIFSRPDRRYCRRGLLPLHAWVVGDYALTEDGEEQVTSLTKVRIRGGTVDRYEATQGHIYAAWGFIGHNVKRFLSQ